MCKGFEDYAQAKYKSSGEPTIIRLMTHEGNMNPLMSQVDMVPDEDLNTKLKFYVSRDVLKISVMKKCIHWFILQFCCVNSVLG